MSLPFHVVSKIPCNILVFFLFLFWMSFSNYKTYFVFVELSIIFTKSKVYIHNLLWMNDQKFVLLKFGNVTVTWKWNQSCHCILTNDKYLAIWKNGINATLSAHNLKASLLFQFWIENEWMVTPFLCIHDPQINYWKYLQNLIKETEK